MSNLLDFQENIDALWQYWHGQLKSAKHWVENDEGWIRCHPESFIVFRKGYVRSLRRELKRRKASVEQSKKRAMFAEAMLKEIEFKVDETNERVLSTN
jgi:hypothetical protein